MDALETKVLEALARAAVAEKIAERALALAQDVLVKVEILRQIQVAAPQTPMQNLDPFVPRDEEIEPQPVRLSPFAISGIGRGPVQAQTLKEANEEAEKPLSDSDPESVREQLWDREN